MALATQLRLRKDKPAPQHQSPISALERRLTSIARPQDQIEVALEVSA
jgi:hypothetical protein